MKSFKEYLKEHWWAPHWALSGRYWRAHELLHAYEDAIDAYNACKTQVCRDEWLWTMKKIRELYDEVGGNPENLPDFPDDGPVWPEKDIPGSPDGTKWANVGGGQQASGGQQAGGGNQSGA